MIPIHSKIGQGMRIHVEKLVFWYGKNELIPVNLENNIFNFYLCCILTPICAKFHVHSAHKS